MPDPAPPPPDSDATDATGDEARFETRLARLEKLLADLESGELPLEDALRTYEQGVAELRRCYEMLDAAESRVQKLIERRDGSLGTEDMQ